MGCGEGGLVVALANAGCEAYGMDIKDINIEISRIRAQKYDIPSERFRLGNCSNTGYPEACLMPLFQTSSSSTWIR